MFEEPLAADVPEVRDLHPAIARSLVGKVISVLEDRPPKVKNRQIRLLQNTQPASPLKGFRVLHGRLAICTACGAPIEDPRFINDRCTRRVDGRRCNGTYGITMSPRDWKRCGSCSGLGFRGDRRRNLCWGTGWAYVGEKNY